MGYPMNAGLDNRILVRVREFCVLPDGRRLSPHGLYGSLHAVHRDDALRLLEAGVVKLPASFGLTRHLLRQYCERHAV